MSETTSIEPLKVHDGALSWGMQGKVSYSAFKRMMDIAAVLLLLPIVLPIIGVLAFFVALDGGPAFFVQSRVGRHRSNFSMWKLRTMVENAEEQLQAHLASDPAARDEWTRKQKLTFDPRITPVGHFLRKYSLDELPQLLNVLIGDMSLVGPRPMCPNQCALYSNTEYYEMRPGITGLWQVSERNLCSFAERAHYDSEYASTLGLAADMRILWRTTAVVLRGTGL